MLLRNLSPVILFFLVTGTGIWLSNLGKPLNTAIFTIHKLIALVAVVFTIILLRNVFKSGVINPGSLLLIILGVSVLALFITGALLSLGKSPYSLLLITHIIATISAVITLSLAIYPLFIKK